MTMLMPAPAAIPFRRSEGTFGALSPELAAQVVAAASDVALVVDRAGVIVDLSVNSPELAKIGFAEWLDQPWIETVTDESRPKVAEMLRDAAAGRPTRWREVNHPTEAHETTLIRYFALSSGESGDVIVIGRDLRSNAALQQRLLQVQQSVERDYLRLRQTEARYRLLFQSSSEAVLVVDVLSRRVREANPAACRMTEVAEAAIAGQLLTALLDPASVEAAAQLLSAVQSGASTSPVTVRLASGVQCRLSASLFRQDRSSAFLVRFTPQQGGEVASEAMVRLNTILDRISDAFVVTDADLRILTVNPAFLDLVHVASNEEVRGETLDRYLGRLHVDLKVMLSQLREHGSIRNFATVLRERFGGTEDVEVSAVAALDADPPCLGFSIRSVSRRGLSRVTLEGELPRSVEQLTQLIGRVPMKEIVRESTDLIERLCIEAALTLTTNNRASAADLLGLSRQSLYSKLHRYGLGSLDDAAGH